MSRVSPALQAAYAAANYAIRERSGSLRLRIGGTDAALASLLARHGSDHAALVSAFNPRSERLSRAMNRQRHAWLLARLQAERRRWLPARNSDPGGDFPAEAAVLIFDLDLADARGLGRAFDQNAVVLIDARGLARLCWLR
ncbi:MAG TPA: DUF3293 domain-containing protein [Rhodanobacteraceae bacterium]|nr:DUF3293 domain-containing protein [Rhodanobacteraceae bacterium]